MCGIAGSISWQKSSTKEKSLVQKMVNALSHRGPDYTNTTKQGAVILGHARLSIIDLDIGANQPFCDVTKRYHMVYNGELYNYIELKKILQNHGVTFRTDSDTEVILEAWKLWQEDALERFIGMYAFCIWDTQEEQAFIARDRMGEKPFFMYPYDGKDFSSGVIFSSELTSLLQHPHVERNIDQQALSQYLSLNYVLTNACMIHGVKKLPPAHYAWVKKDQPVTPKEYWSLATAFTHKYEGTKDDASQRLNDLLSEIIKGQVRSDVSLGAFLSGGIDSSTIVAAMTKQLDNDVIHTYGMGFKERSYDETIIAKQTADAFGVHFHQKTITPHDLESLLESMAKTMGEPFADNSMIPTYYLTQFAKEHVTVALSGDGGDELFLGYETYLANTYHQYLSKVPNVALDAAMWLAYKLIPTTHHKVSFDYKLRQFIAGCKLSPQRAHYHWRTIFQEEEKQKLYHFAHDTDDPFESFSHFFQDVQGCHFLDQASYVDMKTWLVDDILVKVDRLSMAHSLETRVPFLDHRMVEFAASLPVAWKLHGKDKKHILKYSQRSTLPNHLLKRKKQGFNAPMSSWLSGDLLHWAKERTLDTTMDDWFNRRYVEQLWHEHQSGQADHGFRLFGLLQFQLWQSSL